MHRRSWISIATLSLAAMVAAGCGGDDSGTGGTGTGTRSKPKTKTTATAPNGSTAAKTAPPPPAGSSAAPAPQPAAASGTMGKGVIKGVVSFKGTPPEMKVPTKRKDHEFCKDKPLVHNAVIVKDGKLKDVYVRIAKDDVKGEYTKPGTVDLDQRDCQYTPRIQGAVVGQKLRFLNSDPITHNVATPFADLSNASMAKDAKPIEKELEEADLLKFRCDIHPYMRAFVFVEKHPFFGVSGEDGTFKISELPDGKYHVEAWHSQFGWKKAEKEIEIKGDSAVDVNFEYTDKDGPAEENKEEKDLF